MKKVSVIVPVYNNEKYIKKCLTSILNQTYLNIEVLVVNDGSTDDTKKILDLMIYPKLIIFNNDNHGVSYSRNFALRHATGDYITFVDSDDWLEKNAIEIMINLLEKNDADAVRTNYYIHENGIKRTPENYDDKLVFEENEKQKLKVLIRSILNGNIPAYLWLLLIKREVILNIFFEEDISMMEDTIFYLNFLKKIKKIVFTNERTYHYLVHDQSLSHDQKNIKRINEVIKVDSHLAPIVQKHYASFYQEFKNRMFTIVMVEIKELGTNQSYITFSKELKQLKNNANFHLFIQETKMQILGFQNKILKLTLNFNFICFLIVKIRKICSSIKRKKLKR